MVSMLWVTEQGAGATTRRGEGSLGTGVAAADHDYVEFAVVAHGKVLQDRAANYTALILSQEFLSEKSSLVAVIAGLVRCC